MTPVHKRIWRRAKLQIADDVRLRLDTDLRELDAGMRELNARIDSICTDLVAARGELSEARASIGTVLDTLATQLDMENEANELVGRLLVRLSARLDDIEGRTDEPVDLPAL